jgi:hypothetical protein
MKILPGIPIEVLLGNRVVVLFVHTLVAPCRVLLENLAWYLKRLVFTPHHSLP